jgi:succinate-acetate transporter protein
LDREAADPAALGFGGLALNTFLFSMVNAGMIPAESLGAILCMAFSYGGLAQFTAGMWDLRRGSVFGGTFFSSIGAFWMGLAATLILQDRGILPVIPAVGMAVLYTAWGIFTGYASAAAVKTSKAATIVLATLTMLLFLLAAGEFNPMIRVIAGYEGIISGLTAWYTSAGTLINAVHGRELIPLGAAGE